MRKIYTVYASIVNGQGQRGTPPGFPKNFDSESYNGDAEKALKRAKGAMYTAFGEMCGVDDRQLQTVFLVAEDGFMLERLVDGALAEPQPEPEPEEEPEAEPEG